MLNYSYITTEEELIAASEEIRSYFDGYRFLGTGQDPILALDAETTGDILTSRDYDKSSGRMPKTTQIIKKVPMPICWEGDEPTGIIRTLQIGLNPIERGNSFPCRNRQFVFDVFFLGVDLINKYLKKFIETAKLIGHNLKYDYQFIFSQMGMKPTKFVDTMLVSKVLLAGDKVNHGLDDSYERFLDFSWFVQETGMTFKNYILFKKQNQSSDWSGILSETQIRYAAEDVYFIFFLLEQQEEWIKDYVRVFENKSAPNQKITNTISLECSLIPVFAKMELRGVPFDADRHREVIQILEEKKKEAADHLGFTRKKVIRVKRYNTVCYLKEKGTSNEGLVHRVGGKDKIVWEEDVETEETLNINSSQQLIPKLYELLRPQLGNNFRLLKTDGKEEKDSAGEDIIKEAYFKYEEELTDEVKEQMKWVLQYKKASSLLSKFGEKVINFSSPNGYLYPSWWQIGEDENAVATGRSSSSRINLQNIPGARGDLFPHTKFGFTGDGVKLFRNSIKAKPGWKLVVADLKQIEPRVAAEVCRVKELIKRFQEDTLDIHAWVAKIMLGLDEEPSKDSYERKYIGKTAGLSILYGKHWKTLKDWMFKKTDGKVKWTDEQAEAAWNKFFENAPEFRLALRKWEREVKQRAEDNHFSLAFAKRDRGRGKPIYAIAQTVGGRPRRFCLKPEQFDLPDECLHRDHITCILCGKRTGANPEDFEESRYNVYAMMLRSARVEGFNSKIQGTAADILKLATYYVDQQFEEAGIPWDEGIVGVVHDEIILHVREENAEFGAAVLKVCMQEAGKEFLKEVPVDCDHGIGDTWANAKP